MLSYEEKCDKARQFIVDCEITDNREEFELSPVPMYLVKNIDDVWGAYIKDLESREGFEDEDDVGAFLDRHNIKWEWKYNFIEWKDGITKWLSEIY